MDSNVELTDCDFYKIQDSNPWAVSDASVFLKYCCPDCDYNHRELIVFSKHALENHKESSVLFNMVIQGSEIQDCIDEHS